jgi:hypothetical protein
MPASRSRPFCAIPADHSRRFCLALLEQTRGEILRWVTIDAVAERIGMDYEVAGALRPSSTRPAWCGSVAGIASYWRNRGGSC